MVYRVAVGHEQLAGTDRLTPVESWVADGRGAGPCGGTLASTASDLLRLARLHLRNGETPDGNRVLSTATSHAMREPQVTMVDPAFGDAWGLGWEVPRVADPRVVGHGGNTDGQQSQLLLVPERQLAVCVLTNGDGTGRLRAGLCDDVLENLAGVRLTRELQPAPPGTPVELAPFRGSFGRDDVRFDFRPVDSALHVTCVTGGEIERHLNSFSAVLTYVRGSTFTLRLPNLPDVPVPVTFVWEDRADGPATHVALSGRVLPRVPEAGDPPHTEQP
jgi:CubicO group peptidase (beta-lactamase class C family)